MAHEEADTHSSAKQAVNLTRGHFRRFIVHFPSNPLVLLRTLISLAPELILTLFLLPRHGHGYPSQLS